MDDGGKEKERDDELTCQSEAVFLPVLAVVDSRSDDFLDEGLQVERRARRRVSLKLEGRRRRRVLSFDDIASSLLCSFVHPYPLQTRQSMSWEILGCSIPFCTDLAFVRLNSRSSRSQRLVPSLPSTQPALLLCPYSKLT